MKGNRNANGEGSIFQVSKNQWKAKIQMGVGRDGKPLYIYRQTYILILNTGLRTGEALSLRWSDVDFEHKIITVAKNSILTKKRDSDGNRLGG